MCISVDGEPTRGQISAS